ncbi:MAG: hypothetical protein HXY25_04570 [Alphaproteobacteria bacterium]|nr:hypothetical protein [Alphaproteobacteria bacterium]
MSRNRPLFRDARPRAGWLRLAALLATVLAAGTGAHAQEDRSVNAIKHYIFIQPDEGVDLLWVDRWYMTFHAPEVRSYYKAWQRHYVSFRSYMVPEEADVFNVYRGRMTEIIFDSREAYVESRIRNDYGISRYTAPTGGWAGRPGQVETINATIPVNPDEDFLGKWPPPKASPYYRWIVAFRYPEGVSEEDGERWFLESAAPSLAKVKGLRRFVAYKVIFDSQPYRRVYEMWFDHYSDWKAAVLDNRGAIPAPPWGGAFPYVDMVSTFIGERPDIDFINDHRVVP